MKRFLKFFTAIALTLMLIFSFAGCGGSVDLLEENIVDDNYDNYYEIFVYSYKDTNGDGYGDLNGVTEKLDYIRDLGYTGIWLMPIMPCSSYHGYNVTDYCDINPIYGTLDDYDNLITEAHARGIKVIIDLVVNHTSSNHPWFKQAVSALKAGNRGDKYYKYYTFKNTSGEGYHEVSGASNWYYESWFDSSMPDLNLDSKDVRDEIENIMKFWLEKGTDGFRLDGCLYYYRYNNAKSIEFCKWIKDTAVKYNEKAYIVGETWSGRSDIEDFYQSGCDSFFCFPTSQASGWVSGSVNGQSASTYWNSVRYVSSMAGEYIPAPFLGNHDTARIAGVMAREEDKIKFAYGLLSMYSGNTFTYYGDEIGMVGGIANDQDKRIGMLWDKASNTTKAPSGSTIQEYIFPSVSSQLKNSGSILNYYKVCNNARNAFPALMRGTAALISNEDPSVLVFSKTWNNEKVIIAINFSEEKKTVSGIEGTLAQSICVTGSIKQDSSSLTLPKYGIAILT